MVTIKVFGTTPPCAKCRRAEREAHKLFCVPAAVVNSGIRTEGMCPSEATLNNALWEGGLCLK